MRLLFLLTVSFFCSTAVAQKTTYNDSILVYQKKYVDSHEVVTKKDKKYFRFFAPGRKYRVVADFVSVADTTGFIMKTSGTKTPRYYKYGILNFNINNKPYQLRVYRSEQLIATEQYKDYLFVPYTDLTSGVESYGGGKYIEFYISDIVDNKVILDFNKAYNPYCAYVSGYNCPIPPRENDLAVAIRAGEKKFAKAKE